MASLAKEYYPCMTSSKPEETQNLTKTEAAAGRGSWPGPPPPQGSQMAPKPSWLPLCATSSV